MAAKENSFTEWLDSLTVKDYYSTRSKIIRDCKINDQKFRNWKCGLTEVPELAKPIINQIAGYPVFPEDETESTDQT